MISPLKPAKQIFLEAIENHAPGQWSAFLDWACGDDAQLRRRVDVLLDAHLADVSLLDIPAVRPAAMLDQPLPEQLGAQIGPYKLQELLGEGGMGSVFVAEQEEPVRRKVALKIVKPGMDSRQVLARFDAERQALALMDHPNIAKVLDASVTESGRPYFVMELVRGVPITEFCDERRLDPRQRLEIFVQVCHAIQHAHTKGIIHRDVKPTNILVTLHDELAVPKVIDFGIAKATGQRLTEQTVYTGLSQMIGTPLYMSPEQAEMNALDVDTRSDVYSLGVLLYELLTGTTPFEKERLHTAPFDELRRIIREEEPPRPSARLSTLSADLATTLAEHRRSDSRRLQQQLHGDLDWIVLKCLEKDRNRRYETASALAADVGHYLTDEPITAAAPSRLYRARKFVRRNRWPVIASAAVLAGLVVGIIGMTIALASQSRQRAIAERERAQAQLNLAVALQQQRKYTEAEDLYRRELEIPIGATSADQQRAAVTRLRLAEVVSDRRGAAESERLHREALAAYRAAFPPDDPNIAHALNTLAFLLRPQLRFDETEPLFREAYDIHRRAIPADHRAIGESATNLANVLITLGRYAEAEPIAREAIAEHQLAVPRDDFALAYARLELGRDLLASDRFSEAEAALVEAQRMLGPTEGFHVGALSLIALYTTWDQAEPGKGHDAKAQEWLRHLIGTFVRQKATIEAKKSD